MVRVTTEQFQEYYQQWTRPIVIVEEGDVDRAAQSQRKLNAAYWVAYCYLRATGGVGWDRRGARQILEKAIQEQDSIASNNNNDNTGKHRFLLATCVYDRYDGERQRTDELFRQAAPRLEIEAQRGGNDDNHILAAHFLARCLSDGRGVDKDMCRAIHWYKIAAELGNEDSKIALRNKCRNEPTVFDWFKQMAVEHEHAWAQRALGQCYEYGDGVEKDLVKTVEWYNKAIAQGCQRSTHFRNCLVNNLSPEVRDKTLGCVERNQKIEKVKVFIHQQPMDSVPLGLWSFVLGSFQNPIHHPCESPSPTFIALCEGIMPQFKKESNNDQAEVVVTKPCSYRKRSLGEISTTC